MNLREETLLSNLNQMMTCQKKIILCYGRVTKRSKKVSSLSSSSVFKGRNLIFFQKYLLKMQLIFLMIQVKMKNHPMMDAILSKRISVEENTMNPMKMEVMMNLMKMELTMDSVEKSLETK